MKSEKRSVLRALSAVMLMLVIMVFALAVSVSAANAQGELLITEEHLNITGAEPVNGKYTKAYDGTTGGVSVTLKDTVDLTALGLVAEDAGKVTPTFEATFTSAEAGDCRLDIVIKLEGENAYKYTQPATLHLPAKIAPVELSWKSELTKPSITLTYDPAASSYKLAPADVLAVFDQNAIKNAINADAAILASINTANITVMNVAELSTVAAGSYTTTAAIDLGNPNYVIADLPVDVTVDPLAIDSIVWGGATTWTYGDNMPITLQAYVGSNAYNVITFTCDDPDFAAGNAGSYTLVAALTDPNFVFASSIDLSKKALSVVITPKEYVIEGIEDVTVIGDEKTLYNIAVKGNMPASVLELFKYSVGDLPFEGTFQYGSFEITVIPPSQNYKFYLASGKPVTADDLKATLTIKRQQLLVPVYNEAGEQISSVILVNKNGFLNSVKASITALEGYPDIVKNNKYNQVYKLLITGAAEGDTFSIVIPILDQLLIPGTDELTLNDLCVYESANGSLTPAGQLVGLNYSVMLGEGYYQLDGYIPGNAPITLVISPDFHAPFFTTVPGILLIILIILIILLVLFYIGLLLRRNMEDEETVVVVTDADEEEKAEEAVAEEPIDEELDQMAEAVEAEEEPVDEELVEEAVEEAMEDLAEELEAEPEAEPEADDTVETMAVVEEAEENEDEDAEDAEEEDDTFAFAADADPSTFIDIKEEPEAYAAMLERERLGEIRIVYRYKKSFTAKLAQSLGNVQDYYSEIKNLLLSFKGVKNRVSWNYEAYNKGRVHVAKIIAKSKTLYVYLALNPEDLVDTKYNFVDVSSKKKYATTPVLMKVKGDRKFKHTLELIEKLCGEQMELKRLENEPVDYKVERMTIEELVDAGYIKHLAGYVLLVEEPEAPAEEAVTEEIAAEEATETTEITDEVAPEVAEVADEDAVVADVEVPTEDITE